MYHPLCVSGGATTTASPHTAAECYCCGRTRMCECKLSDETQEKPHCSHVPQLPETTATTTEVTISKFHKGHTSVRQQAHYKLIWLVLQTRTLCLIQQQEHDRSLCLNLQTKTLCLLVLQFGLSSNWTRPPLTVTPILNNTAFRMEIDTGVSVSITVLPA